MILKMTILINLAQVNYVNAHGNFQCTEAAIGEVLKRFTKFSGKRLFRVSFFNIEILLKRDF